MPNTPPPLVQFAKIDKFFGGIVRDEKNPNPTQPITGFLAMEELDPFTNASFIQAEQVVSVDTMPANTAIYARAIGADDTSYGVGSVTTSSAPFTETGQARIVSMASGSASSPGSFTTLFTSADTTNLLIPRTDLIFYKSTEASDNQYLLYIKRGLDGGTYHQFLMKYTLTGTKETGASQVKTATATPVTADILLGFDEAGTTDTRAFPTMKNIFGDIYICNGRYISKFDRTGAFTQKAFTLSVGLEAVDIEQVGTYAIIYCRDTATGDQKSLGVWWDLAATSTVTDVFNIPMGGPCWIKNYRENVILFNVHNGVGKFFRLTYPSLGAQIVELPNIQINGLIIGPTSQFDFPSLPKMVSQKDKFLYFGVAGTTTSKSGIYCLGQLDPDKPWAVFLSKRYGTTNHANHVPCSLKVQGPNFYGDFLDGNISTQVADQYKSVRCATLNSPNRSSQAFLQTVWLDGNVADRLKKLETLTVTTKPLAANCTVVPSIAVDYSTSFATWTRNDGTNMAAGNRVGNFTGDVGTNNMVYSVKLSWTSSTTSTAYVTSLALYGVLKELAPQ